MHGQTVAFFGGQYIYRSNNSCCHSVKLYHSPQMEMRGAIRIRCRLERLFFSVGEEIVVSNADEHDK